MPPLLPLIALAAPWPLVGLIISILLALSILGVVLGILSKLVYRPARKPALEEPVLPKLLTDASASPSPTDAPKELTHDEPQHAA